MLFYRSEQNLKFMNTDQQVIEFVIQFNVIYYICVCVRQ